MVIDRRIKQIMDKLLVVFASAPKGELRNIAEHNCNFREYKMNNYIYRAGNVPRYCYIVIQGNVKVESPGFEAKKMMEMLIVG